jgi:hypothetical protein
MDNMKKYYFILSLLLIGASGSFAQTTGDYRSKASAAWTALTTWERWSGAAWIQPTAGQGYPGELATPGLVTIVDNNDVSFATGLTVTIGALTFQAGANETTLTIAGTGALTVNGAITMNGSTTTTGTHATVLSIGTGSVSCASLALNPVAGNLGSTNRRTEVTISTGTLTSAGNISCSGVVTGGTGITFSGAGTLNVGGSFMASPNLGLFTESTSTVNFNGTVAQTIDVTNYTYNNVTTNNTFTTGAVFGAAVTATNIAGNITVASGLLRTNNLAFALGASNPLLISAGATLDAGTTSIVFGTGTSDPTINGTLKTANTTGFSGAAGTAISSTNAPTVTFGAASTIEYTAAGTQPVTARTDYANVTLTGASKTITGTVTLSGVLTVNSGATYNGAANPVLTAKSLVNAGTFTSGTAAVTFTSGAAEVITATGTTNFAAVTVNNTAGGVTFSGTASLSGALTLTSGILSLATGSTLTISGGNAVGGSPFSAAKHIATLVDNGTGAQGFLRVNNLVSAAAYTFPVGTPALYLPVTVTPSDVAGNNSFTVCAFTGVTGDGTPNGTPFANKSNIVDAVWTVNYNGPGTPTSASTTLTMNWPASLEGANFAALSNPLIGISHYATPAWGDYVGSGDNVANTATRTGITTFSPFSVGKLGPAAGTLAAKIYYFNASKGSNSNNLNWTAECSSTQVTFDIERSADGRNFSVINSITASQARCALPFSYDDAGALAGTNYYRIKIIDDNGKISYTTIAKVGGQQKDMQLVGILPNPVSNSAQLSITTSKKENVQLAVVSLEGKVVYRKNVQLQSGSSFINLDIANLAPGTYFVRGVFADGEASSVKFVKQ